MLTLMLLGMVLVSTHVVAAQSWPGVSWVGCYYERTYKMTIITGDRSSNIHGGGYSMSISRCWRNCQGYGYFSMKVWGCRCGDSFIDDAAMYPRLPDDTCINDCHKGQTMPPFEHDSTPVRPIRCGAYPGDGRLPEFGVAVYRITRSGPVCTAAGINTNFHNGMTAQICGNTDAGCDVYMRKDFLNQRAGPYVFSTCHLYCRYFGLVCGGQYASTGQGCSVRGARYQDCHQTGGSGTTHLICVCTYTPQHPSSTCCSRDITVGSSFNVNSKSFSVPPGTHCASNAANRGIRLLSHRDEMSVLNRAAFVVSINGTTGTVLRIDPPITVSTLYPPDVDTGWHPAAIQGGIVHPGWSMDLRIRCYETCNRTTATTTRIPSAAAATTDHQSTGYVLVGRNVWCHQWFRRHGGTCRGKTLSSCQTRCSAMLDCNYIAFDSATGHCSTYISCNSTAATSNGIQEDTSQWSVWRRVNREVCVRARGNSWLLRRHPFVPYDAHVGTHSGPCWPGPFTITADEDYNRIHGSYLGIEHARNYRAVFARNILTDMPAYFIGAQYWTMPNEYTDPKSIFLAEAGTVYVWVFRPYYESQDARLNYTRSFPAEGWTLMNETLLTEISRSRPCPIFRKVVPGGTTLTFPAKKVVGSDVVGFGVIVARASCVAGSGDRIGYAVTAPGGTTVRALGEVSCAQTHIGTAGAICASDGSNFMFAGCIPRPTTNPTASPTMNPTISPTKNPTHHPSVSPSVPPTSDPTKSPTKDPTAPPTLAPTQKPTRAPTSFPTKHPTSPPARLLIGDVISVATLCLWTITVVYYYLAEDTSEEFPIPTQPHSFTEWVAEMPMWERLTLFGEVNDVGSDVWLIYAYGDDENLRVQTRIGVIYCATGMLLVAFKLIMSKHYFSLRKEKLMTARHEALLIAALSMRIGALEDLPQLSTVVTIAYMDGSLTLAAWASAVMTVMMMAVKWVTPMLIEGAYIVAVDKADEAECAERRAIALALQKDQDNKRESISLKTNAKQLQTYITTQEVEVSRFQQERHNAQESKKSSARRLENANVELRRAEMEILRLRERVELAQSGILEDGDTLEDLEEALQEACDVPQLKRKKSKTAQDKYDAWVTVEVELTDKLKGAAQRAKSLKQQLSETRDRLDYVESQASLSRPDAGTPQPRGSKPREWSESEVRDWVFEVTKKHTTAQMFYEMEVDGDALASLTLADLIGDDWKFKKPPATSLLVKIDRLLGRTRFRDQVELLTVDRDEEEVFPSLPNSPMIEIPISQELASQGTQPLE